MKVALGIAAASALLVFAGCGGVAELDSGESETVKMARQAVADAKAQGKLSVEGEKHLTNLIVLCRAKPLTEVAGQSMRELVDSLAPQIKTADPEFSKRMKRIATSGCD